MRKKNLVVKYTFVIGDYARGLLEISFKIPSPFFLFSFSYWFSPIETVTSADIGGFSFYSSPIVSSPRDWEIYLTDHANPTPNEAWNVKILSLPLSTQYCACPAHTITVFEVRHCDSPGDYLRTPSLQSRPQQTPCSDHLFLRQDDCILCSGTVQHGYCTNHLKRQTLPAVL